LCQPVFGFWLFIPQALIILFAKKGKRVFMCHDEIKHDSENYLFAYLYLENKTFINAHLLKEGLAVVDNSLEFKYKRFFLGIENKKY
jgi:site-specific DNA-methyltransferase (adenine-specific)